MNLWRDCSWHCDRKSIILKPRKRTSSGRISLQKVVVMHLSIAWKSGKRYRRYFVRNHERNQKIPITASQVAGRRRGADHLNLAHTKDVMEKLNTWKKKIYAIKINGNYNIMKNYPFSYFSKCVIMLILHCSTSGNIS